jgi:chemotaxis family two-component system response regulator Rcp1
MNEVDILLIEDNSGDVLLTKEALQNWCVKCNIVTVNDGEEAMHYLKQENGYATAAIPHLVILDINMPKLDGKQVLRYIRSEPVLQHLPVVIFSSSVNDRDVAEAFALSADLYLQKPAELDHYFEAIGKIEQFWTNYKKKSDHGK